MNRARRPERMPGFSGRRVGLLLGVVAATVLIVALAAHGATSSSDRSPAGADRPGRPSGTPGSTIPVADGRNIYAGIGLDRLSRAVAGDLARVYVPDGAARRITVIDPSTGGIVDSLPAGRQPQHIVPSWDLRTLWVLDNSSNDVFPINPRTGRPGPHIPVDDPYNLYFTPDGSSAIVVAEARQRLDFRDPHTMQLRSSLPVPGCDGINHADYSRNGAYMLVTCEFAGKVAKIDMVNRRVVGLLQLGTARSASESRSAETRPSAGRPATGPQSMPQDVRAGPDGRHFYVADMVSGGVHVIDGETFSVVGFIATGVGAHGITPSRDGKRLYVANRGSTSVVGTRHGKGSVSVVDPATDVVVGNWPVPGGGSPDMGNLSADGTRLWLSGRFDAEVYAFDTTSGSLAARIAVGEGPHGLTVWPQPGSFSLGHTGNTR